MSDGRAIRWITFDVYSALFDFRAGLEPRLRDVCKSLDEVDVAALLTLWRERQLAAAMQHAMLARDHLSFRRATRLALNYALQRFHVTLTETACQALVGAWDALDPWPEVPAVFGQLRDRGCRLALLSNGDQSMLEALAHRLPGGVDAVFSAERAGAYKPQPGVYLWALDQLQLAAPAVLHVAGSATDVMGARSAGLRCIWSNRHADRMLDPAYAPDCELSDLNGLTAAVNGLSSCPQVRT